MAAEGRIGARGLDWNFKMFELWRRGGGEGREGEGEGGERVEGQMMGDLGIHLEGLAKGLG